VVLVGMSRTKHLATNSPKHSAAPPTSMRRPQRPARAQAGAPLGTSHRHTQSPVASSTRARQPPPRWVRYTSADSTTTRLSCAHPLFIICYPADLPHSHPCSHMNWDLTSRPLFPIHTYTDTSIAATHCTQLRHTHSYAPSPSHSHLMLTLSHSLLSSIPSPFITNSLRFTCTYRPRFTFFTPPLSFLPGFVGGLFIVI